MGIIIHDRIIFFVYRGLTSLNLLKEAIPIILAKVIWDADSGMANNSNGKNKLKLSIIKLEEKVNKISIWVSSIAKAGIGLMFEICEPIDFTIFCEKIKAPTPIKSDPKK